MSRTSVGGRLRALVLGKPRDLSDRALFHKVSLVAVLAWVGLGADGLSSSCYGPEETYKALGAHPSLAVFIAFACVGTIALLCLSYRQIIELFPTGGGGYLVASKLLGRGAGVVSGSALLVDYVLTITISIASGADAFFSLLPREYLGWKVPFALAGIAVMTVLNLRGVRESVLIWAPVFFAFIATHAVAIVVALGLHLGDFSTVSARTGDDIRAAHVQGGRGDRPAPRLDRGPRGEVRRAGEEAGVATSNRRPQVGHDLLTEIQAQVDAALSRHPSAVVFGGQLAFQRETFWTRWLHNHVVFALQRAFCRTGTPFVIVPIQVA